MGFIREAYQGRPVGLIENKIINDPPKGNKKVQKTCGKNIFRIKGTPLSPYV
jgi:hypothetical protein